MTRDGRGELIIIIVIILIIIINIVEDGMTFRRRGCQLCSTITVIIYIYYILHITYYILLSMLSLIYGPFHADILGTAELDMPWFEVMPA